MPRNDVEYAFVHKHAVDIQRMLCEKISSAVGRLSEKREVVSSVTWMHFIGVSPSSLVMSCALTTAPDMASSLAGVRTVRGLPTFTLAVTDSLHQYISVWTSYTVGRYRELRACGSIRRLFIP